MSFRLNPFKVMRAVGIVAIIVYGVVLVTGYKKSKGNATKSVTKDIKVRNKDFYKSKDYKNNLTLPKQVVENNNEGVAKELEQTKSAQTVDLQKNNQAEAQAAAEAKKKDEQAKLEAQKLEMQKQAMQKRQEEAKIAAKRAEIKKNQQIEAAKRAQVAAQAKAEEDRKRAKAEAAKKAKENAKKHQGSKKYIQVASVTSEATAKGIAKRLGGNFYYKKTTVNGKAAYVVMSNMTDNPNTLKVMESQAKKAGGGYMIRSVGK